MKLTSQNQHDRVLWILSSHGELTKSRLRQRSGLKKDDLNVILADLEKEGRITRTIDKRGELIALKG